MKTKPEYPQRVGRIKRTPEKATTVFSLMDRAKLSEKEVKVLGEALRDTEEYIKDVLVSVNISNKKIDIIRMENERAKAITPDFMMTYKDMLCKNEETKTSAHERLLVVQKFQEMLKEVTT